MMAQLPSAQVRISHVDLELSRQCRNCNDRPSICQNENRVILTSDNATHHAYYYFINEKDYCKVDLMLRQCYPHFFWSPTVYR